MRILFAASEAVPFCKTGGLADVAGALAKVLHHRGHDVRLVIPRYQAIDHKKFRMIPILPELDVQYGDDIHRGSVLRCSYPNSDMPVYFIDERDLFSRAGIYSNGSADYVDNHRRFGFFSMAVLWMLKGLDWQPDIIHIHDWQTGLIAALLRHHPVVTEDPFYKDMKTVFSIHNLAYQGNFDKFVIPAIGLPWEVFKAEDGMEFYGKASFLKAGLVYADELVAVSPTYSREIQIDEQGAGMAGTLRAREKNLHGILNGIDTDLWNSSEDPSIPATYSIEDLSGKMACKASLQKEMGLPVDPAKPLVGMISRLVAAKGYDLICRALEDMIKIDGVQFVVLGSGEHGYEEIFQEFAKQHPDRLAARIGYDETLSHQIIAGADIFLMPSYFEPCGLTQLYSMTYGAIPVVRKTGGLADSVIQIDDKSLKNGTGTGFLFSDYTPAALIATLEQAVELFTKKPGQWKKAVANAMSHDFSWNTSAKEYERLYRGEYTNRKD